MKQKPISPNGRQHVNLSQYAFDIVRSDSLNFLGTLNNSGFINTIIENSSVDSFDELALIEEERIKTELSTYTSKPTEAEIKIIKKIASAHKFHVLNTLNEYPKNVTLKIKLNVKLHNKLYPTESEWFGDKYNLSQGEYIKSIIEEYARKTYFERESIFYKERIEELERYISAADNEKRILLITMKDGRKSYFKPYRLSEEYETNYHYLIGLSAEEGTSDYIIASLRLSRIADIKQKGRSIGSGKITKNEIRKINDRIKESGIPYLLGTPTQFTIRLTKMGMILYDYKYSQRPIYNEPLIKSQDDTYLMNITATERQIQNYFFAFGKEAVILSPNETQKWMAEKYNSASDLYTSLQNIDT